MHFISRLPDSFGGRQLAAALQGTAILNVSENKDYQKQRVLSVLTFSALYYSWLASEFFNQFLKGIPNHVDDWPRVTLEIRKAPFPFFGNHDDGPVALGWLRVSHRELDETRSIPFQPYHKHQRELKLKPGEIAPVEIEIWPSSTVFEAGEKLRITVQGSDIYFYPEEMHTNGHTRTVNKGRHVIHSGGKYDSHLLVPLI